MLLSIAFTPQRLHETHTPNPILLVQDWVLLNYKNILCHILSYFLSMNILNMKYGS